MRIAVGQPRSIRNPEDLLACALVALYLLFQYFSTAFFFILPAALLQPANVALLGAGLLVILARHDLADYEHQIAWAILFGILCSVSSLAMGSGVGDLAKALINVASVAVTYLLFCVTARSRSGLQIICVTLALCAAVNSAVAVWGAFSHQQILGATRDVVGVGAFGYDATSGRSGGIVGENYAGMANLPALVAGLALLREGQWRIVAWALMALGVVGTAVSVSRTSVLSALVATLVFFFMSARQSGFRAMLRVALLVVCAAGVGAFAYTRYVSNLDVGFQKSVSERWSELGLMNELDVGRGAHWRVFGAQILDHPLMGRGAGYLDEQFRSYRLVPHNSFIDVAVEFGIPALLVFSVALLQPLTKSRQAARDVRTSYIYACFAGMLTTLLTLSSPFGRILWATAGALHGACKSRYTARVRAPGNWMWKSPGQGKAVFDRRSQQFHQPCTYQKYR